MLPAVDRKLQCAVVSAITGRVGSVAISLLCKDLGSLLHNIFIARSVVSVGKIKVSQLSLMVCCRRSRRRQCLRCCCRFRRCCCRRRCFGFRLIVVNICCSVISDLS